MNFKIKWFLIPVFLFFISNPVFSKETLLPTSILIPSEVPHSVKIALLRDVSSVSIKTEGSSILKFSQVKGPILIANPIKATMRADDGGIRFNGHLYSTDRITISLSKGSIQVGSRKYGKQVQILRKAGRKLTVINEIDLEEYLKGVLPLEVHMDWPIESLKAQAVVSRTFALFKTLEKQNQDFFLMDTVHSQVYGGSLFHQDRTDQAVELTRGEVLISGGKLFPAYFHAACGGRTAQADQIWKVEPNPVLNGVVCNYCKGTRHWRWSLKLPLKKIEEMMNEKGYPAKNLTAIEFQSRDKSGRATKVILKYKYSDLSLAADDFRTCIGNDKFKSLKVNVRVKDGVAYFVGYGWGHGIGFCQWGSKVQAGSRKNYREILEFYFPGSKIRKI